MFVCGEASGADIFDIGTGSFSHEAGDVGIAFGMLGEELLIHAHNVVENLHLAIAANACADSLMDS